MSARIPDKVARTDEDGVSTCVLRTPTSLTPHIVYPAHGLDLLPGTADPIECNPSEIIGLIM